MSNVIQFPGNKKKIKAYAPDHLPKFDHGDRMSRIRDSLNRINNLMSELKRMGDVNRSQKESN